MLRIALPNKGRLAADARALFSDAGLELRAAGDRALTASLGDALRVVFVRAQDVPEFVADGAANAGVTGWDLIAESERELETLLDLEFGRCRLVVATRDDAMVTSLADFNRPDGVPRRVATVFPRLTRHFFASRGWPINVIAVSGAVEVAPHLGIADVIVDLTSTGSTLAVNGLRELGTVLESTARLVAAPRDSSRLQADQRAALEDLVSALASVLCARSQRYLMANVPRTALERVKAILPGLRGPTVTDILNGGTFVAVHAVVPATGIYRLITALKELGGEGILVTRIERLTP